MIRIGHVPIERVGQGSARDGEGHRVGPIRRHLAVKRDPIVDRGIRREDRLCCGDACAIFRCDPNAGFELLDFNHRAVRKDPPALLRDGGRNSLQVLERVKRGLVRIAQRRRVFESLHRHALETLDLRARLHAGFIFLLCLSLRLGPRHPHRWEQIGVKPPEIAGDAVCVDDLFDAVDRGFLALLEQPRCFLAPQLDKRTDSIVADWGEMRGGPRRHSAGHRAAVEHHDRAPGADQFIGGGEAGNPRADDHDVATQIVLKGRSIGRNVLAHPQGLGGFAAGIHDAPPLCTPPAPAQLAALRLTFFSAMPVSFLSAAFSSLSVVVRSCATASLPSSSAHAISVP